MEKCSYQILASIAEGNGEVLATIVGITGSAYKKKDTMMLFHADGSQTGILSVGCLEEDARLQAKEMLALGEKSRLITYDMSREDDLGWGLGNGCQGIVDVLLELINEHLRFNLRQVFSLIEQGHFVTVYKNIAQTPNLLDAYYIPDEGSAFGQQVQQDAVVYTQCFHPQPRLIIFGAGDDVPPLANLAKQVGFKVFVWDWRLERLKEPPFSHVEVIKRWQTFEFSPDDMVIIMTHVFEKDKEILSFFIHNPIQIAYLGVMGSKKRTKRLLQVEQLPDDIRTPIGLDIGAEGAYEIAISIMAELIQQKRRDPYPKDCRSLSSGRIK